MEGEGEEGKRVFSAISVRDAKSTVSNRFNLWHFRCKNVIGSVEFFLYPRKFSYGRAPRFNQLFPISSPLSPRLHFFFLFLFLSFLAFFFFFFIPVNGNFRVSPSLSARSLFSRMMYTTVHKCLDTSDRYTVQ